MSLAPYGRIRINVTGARGAIGIDFDTEIEPGEFLVKSPSGPRKFSGASGVGGADAALRTDLAGGAGSGLVKYTPLGGQPAKRSVEDRLRDNAVSILDYYQPTDPDFTLAAQRAAATGLNIYLPRREGGYVIRDGITITGAQQIFSDGARHGYFYIPSDFNMDATGVITITTGASEYQAGMTNVGIVFYQPAAPNSVDDLVKYPYAVNGYNVSRMFFGGSIRIENAWNGLNFGGNVGGLIADTFEISAYNRAYTFDGALDSVHINTLKLWPYIAANTPQSLALYYAGKGGFIGHIDGLDIKTIAHFGNPLTLDTASGISGIGTIANLQLDGVGSRLIWNNHRYIVGSLYSTAAKPDTTAIAVTGGCLGIGRLFLQGNGRDPAVGPKPPSPVAALIYLGVGAQLQVSNADILAFGSSQSVIRQEGGVLDWHGGVFNAYNDVAYEAPLIDIAGGLATVKNPRFLPGLGNANIGIRVVTDNWHDIEINAMMGWTKSVPSAPLSSTFKFGSTIIGAPPL